MPAGRYTASPGASEIRFSSSEISTPDRPGTCSLRLMHRGQLGPVRLQGRAGGQRRTTSAVLRTSSPPAISRSKAGRSPAPSSAFPGRPAVRSAAAGVRIRRSRRPPGGAGCRAFRGGPETAQRFKRRQRKDHFRLVVVVPVVPVGRVRGDAFTVFAGKAGPRLLQARVDLQRQRLGRSEDLGEEGQARPEPATETAPRKCPGSSAISASSGTPFLPSGRVATEGESGWAPIHSSASGPPDSGRPSSPAIAVVDPQA